MDLLVNSSRHKATSIAIRWHQNRWQPLCAGVDLQERYPDNWIEKDADEGGFEELTEREKLLVACIGQEGAEEDLRVWRRTEKVVVAVVRYLMRVTTQKVVPATELLNWSCNGWGQDELAYCDLSVHLLYFAGSRSQFCCKAMASVYL